MPTRPGVNALNELKAINPRFRARMIDPSVAPWSGPEFVDGLVKWTCFVSVDTQPTFPFPLFNPTSRYNPDRSFWERVRNGWNILYILKQLELGHAIIQLTVGINTS